MVFHSINSKKHALILSLHSPFHHFVRMWCMGESRRHSPATYFSQLREQENPSPILPFTENCSTLNGRIDVSMCGSPKPPNFSTSVYVVVRKADCICLLEQIEWKGPRMPRGLGNIC